METLLSVTFDVAEFGKALIDADGSFVYATFIMKDNSQQKIGIKPLSINRQKAEFEIPGGSPFGVILTVFLDGSLKHSPRWLPQPDEMPNVSNFLRSNK